VNCGKGGESSVSGRSSETCVLEVAKNTDVGGKEQLTASPGKGTGKGGMVFPCKGPGKKRSRIPRPALSQKGD
jgi:hypothetical protein